MTPLADEPILPDLPAELELEELTGLHDDAVLGEVEIPNVDLSGTWANDVSFEGCAFAAADISSSQLERLRLTDVTVSGCNLANLKAPGARWTRVRFENCRLTGLQLLACELRDVAFCGCRIDLASFATGRLQRVAFEGCVLTQAEFVDTELESGAFQDCEMAGADIRGARLRRCEFRRTSLLELQGIGNLRGSGLEWAAIVEMAGVWANALGVEALDEPV